MNYCVYRHLKPCGEVFYIGIGDNKRPFIKSHRNKYWKNIVIKYGYEIDILKSNLSWEEAQELEKILISWYGRRDLNQGTLVNMTDGGEGWFGNKHSEETKLKISNSKKGRKLTPEHIEKVRKTSTGRYHTEETKQKLRNINLGKKHNLDTIYKIKENHACKKLVIDLQTGIFYDSAKDAAIALNLVYNTLTGRLNGSKFNNTSLIYI